MKKTVLKGVAKVAEKAVQGGCGSKSAVFFYEPQIPVALKAKKLNK